MQHSPHPRPGDYAGPERALELLLQLTAQLTDDRPLEDFLKAVTEATRELLRADHASVRLLDS